MNDDLVGYYAQRATEYDHVYAKPERQSDIRQLRQLFSTLFSGRDVLEVSCGTGYWTEVMAPGARSVTACDINEAVLAIARAKDWSASQVEFRRADSYALPDFGRTFSGGFSGFWWSHIPKERLISLLVGFHASLAKGALVAFVDNRYVEGSSTTICRTDSGGNTFQSRRLADGSVHEVLKNFPSKGEIEAALGGMAASVNIRFLEYYWLVSYRVE